eukprot:c9641_g1_i3.p1 GENE.c9641_g1_i3~~c9641_g1_i3.p1  ORF type:complete len:1077 (+),score=310.73 c9641_g1_i3:1-3231(+)
MGLEALHNRPKRQDQAMSTSLHRRAPVPVRDSGDATPASSTSSFRASGQSPGNTTFRHSVRFGFVLIPILGILVTLGRSAALVTLLLGTMFSYALDMSGHGQLALLVWWGGLISMWISTLISVVWTFGFDGFILVVAPTLATLVLCVGFWGSLQFSWMLNNHPQIVLLMEKMLFTHTLIPSSTVVCWLCLTSCPSALVALLTCAYTCITYGLFSIPIPSSFQSQHDSLSEPVLSKLESSIHTLYTLIMPPILYLALHKHAMFALLFPFGVPDDSQVTTHLLNAVGLSAVSILSVSVLAYTNDALWWLDTDDEVKKHLFRITTVISATLLGVWFEMRVLFGSYASLISLPSPFSYIFITVGVYGFIFALVLHSIGVLHRLGLVGVTAILEISCMSLVVAFGVPVAYILVLAVGVYFLARFYFDKSIRKYSLFSLCATAVAAGFMLRHFFFLDFTFPSHPSLSVQIVTVLLLAALVLTLVIPGLAIAGVAPQVPAFLLTVHCGLLSVLEHTLHHSFPAVYPAYLVVLTSGVGLALSYRMHLLAHLPAPFVLVLPCGYIAKFAVLLPNPAAMVVTCGMLAVLVVGFLQGARGSRVIGLVIGSLACVLLGLDSVVLPVLSHVVRSKTLREAWPGIFMITWGVLLMPAAHPSPHVRSPSVFTRLNTLMLLAGSLIVTIRPSSNMWAVVDSVTVTLTRHHSAHNPSLAFRPLWSEWTLVVCGVLAAAIVLRLVPNPRSVVFHALGSMAFGFFLGITTCARFLPTLRTVYAIFSVVFMLASLLFFLCASSAAADLLGVRKTVFALLEAMLVGGYMMVTYAVPMSQRLGGPRLLYTTQLVYVCVYLCIHVILAVYLKVRVHTAQAHQRSRARYDKRFLNATSTSLNEIGTQAFTPTMLNYITLIAFLLALVVNGIFLHGPTSSILFFAPLLLCLHQDSQLFPGLTDDRRYFPVIVACAWSYVLSALWDVLSHTLHSHVPQIASSGVSHIMNIPVDFAPWTSTHTTKNIVLLIITLPAIFMFTNYAWNFRQQNSFAWYVLLPLNLIPALASDVGSVRILGVMSMVGGTWYLITVYLIQRRSNNII